MKSAQACLTIFFCLLTATPTVIAAVADEKVRMWAASALQGKPAVNNSDAASILAKVRKSTETFTAWSKLKECRDAGASLDLDLAAAEHYLFIRSFAAEKGQQDVELLPKLYGELKGTLGPAAQLLKTSPQPVSPPDPAVIDWGGKGVTAGLGDYKALTGKLPIPLTGKFGQYKLAIEGYYENYTKKAANPKCNVQP